VAGVAGRTRGQEGREMSREWWAGTQGVEMPRWCWAIAVVQCVLFMWHLLTLALAAVRWVAKI
jgi:hypothetical protein